MNSSIRVDSPNSEQVVGGFCYEIYVPETIVNVTTRAAGALICTVGVALRRYVIGSADALALEIPVTTSAPEVLSGTAPALKAPDGAARMTSSVTSLGNAWSSDAVIF